MKNLKLTYLIKKGSDNNWLSLSDMETDSEKTLFIMLIDRNECNEYCDTLVSVDTDTIRQDFLINKLKH